MKQFNLQSYIHPDTIKTNVTDENRLQLSMKVDTNVNCSVRISVCVTESKNELNVPVMFYTPDRENYVENVNMLPGLKQEIIQGEVEFSLDRMLRFDLTKNTDKYYPLIVSINYTSEGQ